ncbi:MAG TPA: SDR family oxidoreductase [Solirubrobacteraceae bacterium]|nr:SDR family oxidoreductase [Solirubrobacteraceae bacterium]
MRTKPTGAVSACDGLSILVTGASRGIGRAVAEGLAAAGADVTLAARSQDALREVADGIAASGGTAEIAVADLTGPEAARDVVAQAVDRFGALDGAFVNAGVSVDVPAFEISEEDWRRVLDVNLSGAFFTAQAAGRAMRGRGGSIVFTSSTFAHVAFPLRSAYAASKAGVAHLARQLALEWAPERIRVNAVGPTATLTDLNRERLSQPAIRDALVAKIPLGRLLEPADLIGAVGFLLGRESAMVTGQSLLVDGGFTIQ